MSSKGKIVWGKLALLFIVIHFTFIFVYALPDSFSSTRIKSITTAYIEPIFTQKWAMFAPCPIIDGHVEVRYVFSSGDSTPWISPTEKARLVHNWTKGLHYGELVLAESNLVYWFSLDLDYLEVTEGDSIPAEKMNAFYQGYSYYKIKDYLFGNAKYLYEEAPRLAEIRFQLKDVTTNKERSIYLPIYTF